MASQFFNAARVGDKKALKRFIKQSQGFDINSHYSRNKDTALIIAAREGHKDVMKELIASGAEIDRCNCKRDTALILAVREGRLTVIKEILAAKSKVDVNQINSEGQTALMVASTTGRKDIVQKLLSHGATVNMQDNGGNTALIIASVAGYPMAVADLISSGALVDQANYKGNTALIIAARNGSVAIVLTLLSSSASVDNVNHLGLSALMEAAIIGNVEVIRELVSWGASLELVDKEGNSALLIASVQGHIVVARFLLSIGANLDHTNNEGYTAHSLALRVGHTLLAWELMKACENRPSNASPVSVPPPPKVSNNYPLMKSSSYPRVTFYDEALKTDFTSEGGHTDFTNGIEVTVPPNTVAPGATVSVKVRPSFAQNDVFKLPRGMQSASPSYLVETNHSGEVALIMDHHASVKTQEEADSLCFLKALSAPDMMGKYCFEEVHRESKSEFTAGGNEGRLTTNASSGFFKIGRKLKRFFSKPTPSISNPSSPVSPHPPTANKYSVRIYRSPALSLYDRMVLVVVSLYGRLYTKFLEHFDREVIPHQYPQVSPHPIDHTVWDSLCLKEQCVRLEVGEIPGWEVNTDKETIAKREVDIPDTDNFRPEELHNYPPKIVCSFYPAIPPIKSSRCSMSCFGFDVEVKVNITLHPPIKHVDPSSLQDTTSQLRRIACQVHSKQLGVSVHTFASLMESLTSAISTSFSLEVLSRHTEAINREVQEVLRVSQEMVARCSIETIRCNMEDSLAKMDALSHQLCQVAKAKLKHCQNQYEQSRALEDLIESGTTLMKEFIGLLISIHALNEVQSPIKPTQCPSVNGIAKTVGVHPNQLNQPCSSAHLIDISRLIPDWLSFSIALGLTEQERNSIKTNVELMNYGMKAYKMLEVWLNKEAYSACGSYRRLAEAALGQTTPDIKLAADICKLAPTILNQVPISSL
ncbi:uncharacterized protein LOC135347761 isoform X3 [Halichondria panicea]|uniref:uncharacterized protein LOC135347761 isoform X3 n=1 Tax=Halichondria panicea TaxID=6063 RepID=UPI00312BC16E